MKAFKERHDYLVHALNSIDGFSCIPSDGTFYAFPDVSEAMKTLTLESDVEFAQLLLEKAEVAVVPGSAFGSPGHIRLSYATSLEKLEEAVARIKRVISK